MRRSTALFCSNIADYPSLEDPFSALRSNSCRHSRMENSPLAKLPQELRNRIYENVLVSDSPIRIASISPSELPSVWKPPGLLQTCRQVAAEATAIFYGRNTFWERNSSSSLGSDLLLRKWLRKLPAEKRSFIRRLCLDVRSYRPRSVMERAQSCRYELWTDGLELDKAEVFVGRRNPREAEAFVGQRNPREGNDGLTCFESAIKIIVGSVLVGLVAYSCWYAVCSDYTDPVEELFQRKHQ